MKLWKLVILLIIGIGVWALFDPAFRATLSSFVDTYMSFLMPDTTGGGDLSINPGIPDSV